MKITKTFTFDAAHRLLDHNGKCRHLHGHTYRVEATVEGPDLIASGPERGMLLDFGVLSEWWKHISAVLDHVTILEEGDPLIVAVEGVFDIRLALFPWPPTAENLCLWLANDLNSWLPIARPGLVVGMKVYETPTSWAEL